MSSWGRQSIQTYTGREFFPLAPDPAAIDPIDVAHALSMKCRYTGHCDFFFSVAAHTCLMADYFDTEPHLAAWALMHDASEAYLPDVAGPIKAHLQGFDEIEDQVLRAVAIRFRLPWPIPAEVSRLDKLMYWREREILYGNLPPWVLEGAKRYGVQPEDVTDEVRRRLPIPHWDPPRGRREWMTRFNRLFPEAVVR